MATSLDPTRLHALVPQLAGRRVAVLGDPVLDAYLYGTTVRISREAPVPIVQEDAREHRLGGAANAAANLAALGASTSLVGLIGADDSAQALTALAEACGIDVEHLVTDPLLCTVTKTRVLAGALHTTKQQLLRIDRGNDQPPGNAAVAALIEATRGALRGADALIISHYGDDALTQTYATLAGEARAAGKIVVVDSRYALTQFRGVTAVTPNAPEAAAALGVSVDGAAAAAAAAEAIRRRLHVSAALLTRGREGMAVATADAATVLVPTHGAPNAVDVTGAGDTVTATFTLALTAGASTLEAAVLANCAASVTVQQVGAATCSPAALIESLRTLDLSGIADVEATP